MSPRSWPKARDQTGDKQCTLYFKHKAVGSPWYEIEKLSIHYVLNVGYMVAFVLRTVLMLWKVTLEKKIMYFSSVSSFTSNLKQRFSMGLTGDCTRHLGGGSCGLNEILEMEQLAAWAQRQKNASQGSGIGRLLSCQPLMGLAPKGGSSAWCLTHWILFTSPENVKPN